MRRIYGPAQIQPALWRCPSFHPKPKLGARTVFESEQQLLLEISNHREFLFRDSCLVTQTLPAPDFPIPCQLTSWCTIPASSRCYTCTYNGGNSQIDSPAQLPGSVEPEQHQQQACDPKCEQEPALKMRTPQRVNNRRGVVRAQGDWWFDVCLTKLNLITSRA